MGTRRAIRTHLTLKRIAIRQIRFALHGFHVFLNRTEQLISIKTININSAGDAFFNRFQCELRDRQQNSPSCIRIWGCIHTSHERLDSNYDIQRSRFNVHQ